jgi:hypothetical protein
MTTATTVAAWTALGIAAAAATLAYLVMRQSGGTLETLRRHRNAHQRTHGRPDPDPEHPDSDVADLETELTEIRAYLADLTDWAHAAEQQIDALTTDKINAEGAAPILSDPTQAMPAQRPRPQVTP